MRRVETAAAERILEVPQVQLMNPDEPRLSPAGGSACTKLLFVCSQNRMRSLTAEKIFQGRVGYQARSVGTQPDARIVVTEGHLGWADLVVCMEKSHRNRLWRKFPEAMQEKRVVCLHIPDDYEFMQPELIDELEARLAPHLTSETH